MSEQAPDPVIPPEGDPTNHQLGPLPPEMTANDRDVLEAARRVVEDAAQDIPQGRPLSSNEFSDEEAVLASAEHTLNDASQKIGTEDSLLRMGNNLGEQMRNRATTQAREDYLRGIAEKRRSRGPLS